MAQDNLNTGNKKIAALIIPSMVLTCFLISDIYLFFEKEATAAKLLAAGSFIILLPLLTFFWVAVIKNKLGR